MTNKSSLLKLILITLFFVLNIIKSYCIPTNISATIENSKDVIISVEYQREFLIREKINFKISKAGQVSGKIDVLYPVLVKFSTAQIHFEAYVYPGSGLAFNANGLSQSTLENSLQFKGPIGEINNAFFDLYNHSTLKNKQWSTGDKGSLLDLTKKIKDYYDFKNQYLQAATSKLEKSPQIQSILYLDSINDEFTKASALLTLVKKNGLIGYERQKFLSTTISSAIFDFPSQRALQIPAVTNFWNYSYLSFLIYIDSEKDEGLYKKYGYYLSALNKVDTSFKQPLRDYSRASLLSDLIESPKDFRPGIDSLSRMLNRFIEHANIPEETKDLLEERRQTLSVSSIPQLNGVSVPIVEFLDRGGEKVSLSKFKDSVIVIDCWASWCSPCIAQFPYLEAMKKRFESKKVVFLAVSLDEMKTNWDKALKNLMPAGIQLHTSGGFKGEFAKKFGVNALPRYILIKNSVVANSEAPLPNDPSLIEELNKLLLN